jgi:hypothetical protein
MRLVSVALVVAGCGSVADKKPDAAVQRDAPVDTPSIDGRTCAANPTGLVARFRGEMNVTDDLGTTTATAHGATLGYAPGKHGYAFLLDGSTNVITVDDGDTLWPSGSFSIEAWIKTTAAGVVLEKYQCQSFCPAGQSNAFWGMSVDGSGHPSFSIRTDAMSGSATSVTDSLHDVHDGSFHHLVGVRDTSTGTATLYVDGALGVASNLTAVELGVMSNLDGETDPVLIGSEVTGGTNTYNAFFSGAIDEVSYYSAALTAQQVNDIYTAPLGECH